MKPYVGPKPAAPGYERTPVTVRRVARRVRVGTQPDGSPLWSEQARTVELVEIDASSLIEYAAMFGELKHQRAAKARD